MSQVAETDTPREAYLSKVISPWVAEELAAIEEPLRNTLKNEWSPSTLSQHLIINVQQLESNPYRYYTTPQEKHNLVVHTAITAFWRGKNRELASKRKTSSR